MQSAFIVAACCASFLTYVHGEFDVFSIRLRHVRGGMDTTAVGIAVQSALGGVRLAEGVFEGTGWQVSRLTMLTSRSCTAVHLEALGVAT